MGNISWSPVFVHLYAHSLAALMDKCVQWLETQTWDWWVDPLHHSGETLSCYLLNFFFLPRFLSSLLLRLQLHVC